MNALSALNCTTATIAELKRAFYSYKKPIHERQPIAGITIIATHYSPHNDELFAGFQLMHTAQGKHLLPGIEKATFGPISETELRNKNLLGEEGFFIALKHGILLIGVGKGLLDEHGDRNKHVSTAQLVAEWLGLLNEKMDRKIYERMLKYVNFEDANGDNALTYLNRYGAHSFEKHEADMLITLQHGAFAQNLKKGFESAGSDKHLQQEIFAMAFRFYKNEIAHARLFVEAEHEYQTAEKECLNIIAADIQTPHPLTLFRITCDHKAIHKVAHSKWSNHGSKTLGVLFVERSNGQFVLFPAAKYISIERMKEVMKILRQKIAWNKKLACISFSVLDRDGNLDAIPELYFDENTGTIMNGSKTDPDAPGLIGNGLTVEDIYEAVKIGIDTSFLTTKFANECRSGNCVKGICGLYNFGLKRCHTIRDNAKRAGSSMCAALEKAGVRA